MENNNKSQKENIIILVYKLLNDAVFLMLMVFTALLAAESILPGVVSAHVSFLKVSLIIMALISALLYIGRKYTLSSPQIKIKKSKLVIALIILFLPLAILSLIKFSFLEIFIILIATLLILFYLYKLIFT